MKNNLAILRHWDIIVMGVIIILTAGFFGLYLNLTLGNIFQTAFFGLLAIPVVYMPISSIRYNTSHKDKQELATRLFGVYVIISVVSCLIGASLRFLFSTF